MTHKPKYMCWYEEDFWADRFVSQMPRQARHFYRSLLQAALFCPTRPYLPTDDTELALYADADPQDWQTHKAAVLHKFTKVTIEGVELWSHKRLLEQWEKIQKEYSQWSEMGKKSGESRKPKADPTSNHGSTAVQPELNNIGSGIGSGIGKRTTNASLMARNDNDSLVSSISKTTAKPKTPTNSEAKIGGGENSGEAEQLVQTLDTLLSQRPEVDIPANYEKLWLSDFKAALKEYAFSQIQQAVIYSQLPRNQKYYVRSKSICDTLESLIEQAETPSNKKAIDLLWRQALSGKLPKGKPEEKPLGTYKRGRPKVAGDGCEIHTFKGRDNPSPSSAAPLPQCDHEGFWDTLKKLKLFRRCRRPNQPDVYYVGQSLEQAIVSASSPEELRNDLFSEQERLACAQQLVADLESNEIFAEETTT